MLPATKFDPIQPANLVRVHVEPRPLECWVVRDLNRLRWKTKSPVYRGPRRGTEDGDSMRSGLSWETRGRMLGLEPESE